jgi:hypothetical protein
VREFEFMKNTKRVRMGKRELRELSLGLSQKLFKSSINATKIS